MKDSFLWPDYNNFNLLYFQEDDLGNRNRYSQGYLERPQAMGLTNATVRSTVYLLKENTDKESFVNRTIVWGEDLADKVQNWWDSFFPEDWHVMPVVGNRVGLMITIKTE